MPTLPTDKKIMQAIYRIPSVSAYNRLEAVPRSVDFDRSLQAGIHDAVWMLTRQWQFGEFEGEDAGSPVSARILGTQTSANRLLIPGQPPAVYSGDVPLETTIEAEPVKDSLFLAVQISRYYHKLLRTSGVDPDLADKLLPKYPLDYKTDPRDTGGLQLKLAVGDRYFDGCAMLRDVNTPSGSGTSFSEWLSTQPVPAAVQQTMVTLATSLDKWFTRTYFRQPGQSGTGAWQPASLDYAFTLATDDGTKLSAQQYDGSPVDWYSFDVTGSAVTDNLPSSGSSQKEKLVSFLPVPVSFKGMPNPRFWMMEDGQTDFGRIDTSSTGLLHLLVADFGLIYGNDWFLLPYPMEINTLCSINGLMITDVFGIHTLVNAANTGKENEWQRWALFHQTQTVAGQDQPALFYLPPAIGESCSADPLEKVNFLRDEVASLVWAVEDQVPSQSGHGVSGDALARKETTPAPFTPAGTAAIRYVLGTSVPDNWIPFVPVHMEGSMTEIRLQRAAMPGAKGALGQIITETPAPYYINEEEIPRAGVIVERSVRRTRWFGGQSFCWTGRRKLIGRGEGLGNLRFDQLEDIPVPSSDSQ